MPVNYIILAHRQPQQLCRLVQALSTANSRFYIHIDSKVDLAPFEAALAGHPAVEFLRHPNRCAAAWGDVTIVQAVINAMRQALQEGRQGHVVLLSGQDYPLRHKNEIEDFFASHQHVDFMTCFPLPFKGWSENGGMERITHYKINRSTQKYDYMLFPSVYELSFNWKKCIQQLRAFPLNKRFYILSLILKKRKFPNYAQLMGGAQWWALTTVTCQRILQFLQQHPGYLKYQQHSLIPDEFFFQSILHSLPPVLPIKQMLTYVNWERVEEELPVTFATADFKELRQQTNFLFARKFDMDVDAQILDLLDSHAAAAYEGSSFLKNNRQNANTGVQS